MNEDRYFVDERVGCIAVRDWQNMDDTPGLHHDTKGVVHYWHGCQGKDGWEIPEGFRAAAKLTCETLNCLSK